MKNYLGLFNNNVAAANKAILADINESLVDSIVDSRDYGQGVIKSFNDCITNLDNERDFSVTISFAKCGDKTFHLALASKRGAITLRDAEASEVNEYLEAYRSVIRERDRQWKEEAERHAIERAKVEAERKARQEAAEKARLEKEAAEKLAKRKENAKQKFNDLCLEAKRHNVTVDDEDLVIGWLAKHVTRISAEIPDFLESQFVSNFGENAAKTVVNTAAKSSGGFTKKWSLSSSIHVNDLDTMPPVLQEKFKGSKKINDVKFALNLVYNYGFTFGKEQDVNQIKSYASDSKTFDLGFNA